MGMVHRGRNIREDADQYCSRILRLQSLASRYSQVFGSEGTGEFFNTLNHVSLRSSKVYDTHQHFQFSVVIRHRSNWRRIALHCEGGSLISKLYMIRGK
jgi:hypothetical protein